MIEKVLIDFNELKNLIHLAGCSLKDVTVYDKHNYPFTTLEYNPYENPHEMINYGM